MARAMTMMLLAMVILPGMDAVAKWLSGTVSSGQVSAARFIFQTLFLLPFIFLARGKWLTPNVLLHVARGVLIASATVLFFSGLAYLPIADSLALFFIEPMLVTLLSVALLRESVGWRRFTAILIGFLGAMIVIRPSFVSVGWAVLYPITAALCFSFYILLTRMLAVKDDPIRMQFFAGVFGGLAISLALVIGTQNDIAIFTASWPTVHEFLLLGLLGLVGTVGHLLVVLAFQRAPISVLAPFQYVEIISGTVLGLWLFGDFPEPLTWLGIALIVATGIYIFHRESMQGQSIRSGSAHIIDK
ncbi:MAG: DMT family transporter [Acidiferrobacterales bacterium]|nr:DMT family transporter [Acidiferrobacterales bacterium]